MALDDNDKVWIEQKIRGNTQFSQRIVGDTPTDSNQLTPKKYVDGGFMYGHIDSAGTGALIPDGWSVGRDGLGLYNVTHNFGDTSYIPMVCPAEGDSNNSASVRQWLDDSFQIETLINGTRADVATFFYVMNY